MRLLTRFVVLFSLTCLCLGARRGRIISRSRVRNVTASASTLTERIFNRKGYDESVRPVRDDHKAVDVTFWFLLTGVRSVDTAAHRLTINALVCTYWNDPRLRWNRRIYANITEIRADSTTIWRPEIQPIFSRSEEHIQRSTPLLVDYKGNVTRCAFSQFRLFCRLYLASFPYDEHSCILSLSPVGLISQPVNLIMKNNTDLEPPQRFGEWEVRISKAYTHEISQGKLQLGTAVIELKLQRLTTHYRWTVCVPTACLLLVCAVCSWLPVAHLRSRQALLSGLLLANVILLRHTGQLLEGTEELPTIILLQCVGLGLIMVSTVNASLRAHSVSPAANSFSWSADPKSWPVQLSTIPAKMDLVVLPVSSAAVILWVLFTS